MANISENLNLSLLRVFGDYSAYNELVALLNKLTAITDGTGGLGVYGNIVCESLQVSHGEDVVFQLGAQANDDTYIAIVSNVDTSDPGIAGSLYITSNTLKTSTGT